jgi:hypothetical protein
MITTSSLLTWIFVNSFPENMPTCRWEDNSADLPRPGAILLRERPSVVLGH